MRPFTDALPRELTVEVIEPPGFGASPAPRGVPSTRRLAAAALDAWVRRGLGRAHLFGISIGGMVAQWMAIDAPGLVLASTAAHGWRIVRELGWHPLRLARCLLTPNASACMAGAVLPESPARNPEEVDAPLAPVRARPRTAADLLWLATAAARHDARAALERMRAPALVLTGTDDRIIGPSAQAELTASLPDARQAWLADAAHDLTLEQPDACAAQVAAFLSAPRLSA